MKIAMCTSIYKDSQVFYKYAGREKRQFRLSLEAFASMVRDQSGNELIFVKVDDLNRGGKFLVHYRISAVTEDRVEFEKINKQYIPDIVINRVKDRLYESKFIKNAPWQVYNTPKIASLGNKSVSLKLFYDLMPNGFQVAKSGDCSSISSFIDKAKDWVIKPLRLNGGRDIELVLGRAIQERLCERQEAVIVQEFCESVDIPELNIKGRHDMRIYVIDGEIVLMSVRQPKAGEFLSNTAQGGTIKFFKIEQIPKNAKELTLEVVNRIKNLGCHYFISIDMFLTEEGWMLIEINDQPGLPAEYQTDDARKIFQKYIESIKSMYNKEAK